MAPVFSAKSAGAHKTAGLNFLFIVGNFPCWAILPAKGASRSSFVISTVACMRLVVASAG
jgi:hypothetical protein